MRPQENKGRIEMKKTTIILATIFLLAGGLSVLADQQFIDVVYLKDAKTLQGVIIEQNAGISVKLATEDFVVYTLENNEIERIEKRKTKEALPIYYTDTIFLKDGVIFNGTIIEQRPEQSVVLRMDNGVELTYPVEDIWKIGKQKHLLGTPEPEQEEKAERERQGARIRLHIELVDDKVKKRERETKEEEEAIPELDEEIDRMKEEIAALEEEQEQAEQEVFDERRNVEREEIETLYREIEDQLDGLFNELQECEQLSAEEESTARAGTFAVDGPDPVPLHIIALSWFGDSAEAQSFETVPGSDKSSEQTEEQLRAVLGDVVNQTLEKLPTEEQIRVLAEGQQTHAYITNMLSSTRWWKSFYWHQISSQAEKLSPEERLLLYEAFKLRDPLRGFALNLIPFLYLGSWNQKDTFGALIGYLQTIALMVGGGLLFDMNSDTRVVERRTGYYEVPYPVNAGGWIGIVIMGASPVFGLVEPFWFVARRNKALREALHVDKASLHKERSRTSLAAPQLWIDPEDQAGLRVGLNLVSLRY